jgi:hypothetical protein
MGFVQIINGGKELYDLTRTAGYERTLSGKLVERQELKYLWHNTPQLQGPGAPRGLMVGTEIESCRVHQASRHAFVDVKVQIKYKTGQY